MAVGYKIYSDSNKISRIKGFAKGNLYYQEFTDPNNNTYLEAYDGQFTWKPNLERSIYVYSRKKPKGKPREILSKYLLLTDYRDYCRQYLSLKDQPLNPTQAFGQDVVASVSPSVITGKMFVETNVQPELEIISGEPCYVVELMFYQQYYKDGKHWSRSTRVKKRWWLAKNKDLMCMQRHNGNQRTSKDSTIYFKEPITVLECMQDNKGHWMPKKLTGTANSRIWFKEVVSFAHDESITVDDFKLDVPAGVNIFDKDFDVFRKKGDPKLEK